jgi:hypothetical protein
VKLTTIALSLAVATTTTITASHVALATPAVQMSSKLKTVEIKDDAWGIVAFRMQIPENWSFEGVLMRDPYCGGVPEVVFRITSPDGLAGYQSMPSFGSHWSDNPIFIASYKKFHCKIAEPMSPADFLKYVAPLIRPEPTIGEIQPTVDAKQIDASIAAYNDRVAQAHMLGGETGGGVHSKLVYTFHGVPMEENLRVVVANFKQPAGLGKTSWAASAQVSGLRAPKGQYDAVANVIYPLVGKSAFTDEWMQRQMRKMQADNTRAMDWIRAQGAATSAMLKRNHDAYMKQSRESFEHSQAIARDASDARHRSAVAWTLYAGDQQLVRNASTGQVSQVSNKGGQYGHQDAVSGDIIMSNDPNFDPSYYVRGTWTQLENVDPLKP